ncbi:MAG: hypothetical protein ACFFCM_14725 [Promethearchaeota archaeon]
MIIVGGYKVYSIHVENILTKHPNVELAAIIGIKDPGRPGSEMVKAFIQLKDGVEPTENVKKSLKKYASEQLSKHENPKVWEFMPELPVSFMNKVWKKALRYQEV